MTRLATKLAAASPTVSTKPSQMRWRYCHTKSKSSAMPAIPSDTQNSATTTTTTIR